MSKRRLGCLGVLVAFLILVLSCVVVNWLSGARETPVDMRDLVVDVSAFPEGWVVQIGPYHPPKGKNLAGELEATIVQFERPPGSLVTSHRVLRYRNGLQAAVAFYTTDEFAVRDYNLTPWEVPEGWNYESPTADRFRFACAELEVWDRFVSCRAVAQYDEYVSVFSAHISLQLTPEEVEPILRAIDERMDRYLEEGESKGSKQASAQRRTYRSP